MTKSNWKLFLALLLFIIVMPFNFKAKAANLSNSSLLESIDVNHDCVIDVKDLALAALNYNRASSYRKGNIDYDVNNDSMIDIYDLVLISKHVGGASSPENLINHGNIVNNGIVAKQGEWIYYRSEANEGKLSKIKIDGSSVKKLTEDKPLSINAISGWVYYINTSDQGRVYKVRMDGTGRTKLNDVPSQYITVADGWIYYDNGYDNNKLYKMKVDGTQNTKIMEDRAAYVNVIGDWIYYSNFSSKGEIWKIRTDGTGKKVINNETSHNIIVQGHWIYYISDIWSTLCKIGIDGSNDTQLTIASISHFNVGSDWIYYVTRNESNVPYVIKKDGSAKRKLDFNTTFDFMNVIDDKIYFIDKNNPTLYRINNDGTQKSVFGLDRVIANVEKAEGIAMKGEAYEFPKTILATMADGSKYYVPVTWKASSVDTKEAGSSFTFEGTVKGYSNSVFITVNVIESSITNGNAVEGGMVAQKGDWVYFADNSDGKLYKMKNDDTGKVKLTEDLAYNIHVVGDWIYYISRGNWDLKLVKIKVDGTGRTEISKKRVFSFNMVGDWIVYTNYDDKHSLYKIKTDGSNETKLNDDSCTEINILNDKIYYINYGEDRSIYKINLNGEERTKISGADVQNLNVYKGYIYYANGNEGGEIYKAKADGTGVTKVKENTNVLRFNINNDWIYYANGSDGGSLYKIRVNGTERTKLAEDRIYGAEYGVMNVSDTSVYYKNTLDSNKVYRVSLEGKGRQVFGSKVYISSIEDISVSVDTNYKYTLPNTVIAHMSQGLDNEYDIVWDSYNVTTNKAGTYTFQGTVKGYAKKVKLTLMVSDKPLYGATSGNILNKSLAATNGSLIYSIGDLKNKIVKTKLDGTGKVTLANGEYITEINLVGEWIYYLDVNKLYKIKIDGTGKTKITDSTIKSLNIVGDWVYYINTNIFEIYTDDISGIFKMKLDGTEKTRVTYDFPESLTVENGWIYYLVEGRLCKIRVDGTEKTKCYRYDEYGIESFNVVGDYIYYYSDGNIYKITTDFTERVSLIKGYFVQGFNVSGDWIYYVYLNQTYKIKRDGSSKTLLTTDNALNINVIGEWIYYINNSDGCVYRIKTNGTGREKL